MKFPISVTLNGRRYQREVEPRQLLVHLIRDLGGVTGTKIGCDTSQCGACTVLLDGVAVKSCTALSVQADGASITTIEGLASDGKLHPLLLRMSCSGQIRNPVTNKSAMGWKVICAGVPAIKTSSVRSARPPLP